MRRTTLASHTAAIERNGGAAIRAQRESARNALLEDIRAGLAAQATEIRALEERISDVAYRLVHRSGKVAYARELLTEAVDLVQRVAGGRPLLPFLAEAADAEGSVLRLMLISRILAAMHRVARDGMISQPLTSESALLLDALQERS